MAKRKTSINWQIDGVDIDPTIIKVQAEAAFKYEALVAASKLTQAVEAQIEEIRANSSMRGVGAHASKYNNPFEDAHSVLEETSEGIFKIFVPSEGKESAGYKFNVLDQGSPGSQGKIVTFPIYTGQMTAPNSLDLSNITVDQPVRWYKGKTQAWAGRKILQTVKNDAKAIIKKSSSPASSQAGILQSLANYDKQRGPFRVKYDPTNLKVRMGRARR